MTKQENKLVNYLVQNLDICALLELWEKTDNYFLSADEQGIADYMVYSLGTDTILAALSAPLIEQLVSTDASERQDAINAMHEMGYDPDRRDSDA